MLLYARKNDKHSEEERYRLLQKITLGANRGGRVKIHAEGMENLPEKMDLSFIQIIRDCLMCWLCWRAVQALHGGNEKGSAEYSFFETGLRHHAGKSH